MAGGRLLRVLIGLSLMVSISALSLLGCSGRQASAAKELAIIIDCEQDRKHEAEVVAAYLQQIGIKAEVRTWEWASLKEQILQGNRQMYLTDWGSAYFDPFDLVVPKLKTSERGNYSFYSNQEVDSLLVKVSTETDEAKRRELYHKVQEITFQDAPWIFGYCVDEIGAASRNVQNWQVHLDSRINLHDVSVSNKDSIVVGLASDRIVTLDPAMHRDRTTETVIRNIFDALVTRTWDGRVVLELAESYEQLSPTEYVFHLRRDVRFHDGRMMDAGDVVFTFERILKDGGVGGQSSPRKSLLGPLTAVERVDDYTVKFRLENPFPVFLQALCHFQIVPQHYIEQVGDAQFARQPVGTGPFKFESGRFDDQIVLSRFDGYYGGSPEIPPVGPAVLRSVVFKMMPDATSRIAALKSGDVDMINRVPANMMKEISQDSKLEVKKVPGTRAYMIEMNLKVAPFDDMRVRKALNHAVNWDEILATVFEGCGQRLATAFLPSGFGFNPDLKPYEYSPEKAVKLLNEAGFKASLKGR